FARASARAGGERPRARTSASARAGGRATALAGWRTPVPHCPGQRRRERRPARRTRRNEDPPTSLGMLPIATTLRLAPASKPHEEDVVMPVSEPTLPLSIRELQRTREPLERATALPGAAFTDPRVLQWELENIFMAGWITVGHVDQVRERGDYLMI